MEQGLLKRLRIKFIAINMGLALLVLVITFGTICVLDHTASVNRSTRTSQACSCALPRLSSKRPKFRVCSGWKAQI